MLWFLQGIIYKVYLLVKIVYYLKFDGNYSHSYIEITSLFLFNLLN